MPAWTQNLLVVMMIAGCAAFLLRGAYTALQGRKSSLGGCGTCSGCATTADKPKPSTERVVMVPMDALIRTSKTRTVEKSNPAAFRSQG